MSENENSSRIRSEKQCEWDAQECGPANTQGLITDWTSSISGRIEDI
jgi:hypothetical protein